MATWRQRASASFAISAVALAVAVDDGAGWPAAAASGRLASGPAALQPASSYAGIAISRTRVWVFTLASTNAPGSIIELSPVTGHQVRTLRERKPGQIPWVVAAYQNHPWTTVAPADGRPALAQVSAGGAFTHSVNLAYGITPEGPIAGAAALAGSYLWAATGSPDGTPAGLLQLNASTGTRTRFLHWPRALRFFAPQGMAVSGTQIWMTDGQCQIARVTIRTGHGMIFRLPPRDCQIGGSPAQISVAGGHVWVLAWDTTVGNDGSIAELNARTGHLIRLISGRKYGWDTPSFATAGRRLWVTSQTGGFHGNGSVTELSTSTGRLVHFFSGRQYHFNQPFTIAARGTHAWILNLHSVTKL